MAPAASDEKPRRKLTFCNNHKSNYDNKIIVLMLDAKLRDRSLSAPKLSIGSRCGRKSCGKKEIMAHYSQLKVHKTCTDSHQSNVAAKAVS